MRIDFCDSVIAHIYKVQSQNHKIRLQTTRGCERAECRPKGAKAPYLFFFDFNITISHSLIVKWLWCDIVILKCRFWIKKEHF